LSDLIITSVIHYLGSAVKANKPDVFKDRKERENAVKHPGFKDGSGIWFPLDGADGSPPKELSAKDSAACSCEESEFS
jgi:hypothetical protein